MASITEGTPFQGGLELAARTLIQSATDEHDDTYGYGSMSSAVYDTAWVSLVAKDEKGSRHWLFPECFHYILTIQLDDGSWGPRVSQVDGILNTAASLLALHKHLQEPLQILDCSDQRLKSRIATANTSLHSQLSTWDVPSSTHVGFEVVVPAILKLLEAEGFMYNFPGRGDLERLSALKLEGFVPEMLYARKSSALHSLEAFIGKIDFDKVSHHKVNGAIMASPSATSAYLMNSSHWDDEAESYLRYVVGRRGRSGGVPSAFPSTYFEYTWMISTFLRSGFTASDLECSGLDKIREVIGEAFRCGNGTIGFAFGLVADADDTAKGLMSLNMLGLKQDELDARDLVDNFEADTYFRTYPSERDPSFSANCNVLLALLHDSDSSQYLPQISKIVIFLISHWWDADDIITDKWNLSSLYPTMLLVEAFADFVRLAEADGNVTATLDSENQSRVAITLFQACFRTLVDQKDNGSWNHSMEETSYGIIILSEALQLSSFQDQELRQSILSAINTAVRFISSTDIHHEAINLLWVEKVTYGSATLTEIYRLSALKSAALVTSATMLAKTREPGASLDTKMRSYVGLFLQTPLFANTPSWKLRGSFVEAALFGPMLRARRLATFPRTNMSEDKYFDIIPFTWTACNNRCSIFAPTAFMFEMMIISFLNYQTDEFMETIAGPHFDGRLSELRGVVDSIFESNHDSAGAKENWMVSISFPRSTNGSTGGRIPEITGPLSKFVDHILHNSRITGASPWDKKILAAELRVFLQSHITQSKDNGRFRLQSTVDQYEEPEDTFFHWVRTTAADHTSCPYSFAFVSCLISASLRKGAKCFGTVTQNYAANAFCRHLATLCRMYNDYGSIERDATEWNLNSVNFLEFGFGTVDAETKKRELFKLAQLERAVVEESFRCLEGEVNALGAVSKATAKAERRKLAIFRMFYEVTDLYGQIYVVKDIASTMKVKTS
ncbi:putative Terpene synthase family protein [Seiridium cardinale]|uniref:Terpene synthase family protein n=1 Tax=Seiridium cardinale TaxID=138064 RepID=A0ABR2XMR8_9PEZI